MTSSIFYCFSPVLLFLKILGTQTLCQLSNIVALFFKSQPLIVLNVHVAVPVCVLHAGVATLPRRICGLCLCVPRR